VYPGVSLVLLPPSLREHETYCAIGPRCNVATNHGLDFCDLRAHNGAPTEIDAPQSRVFSQHELSGLQEKPDRGVPGESISPLATDLFGCHRPLFPERLLMERISGTLEAIRLQRQLSLREVEERSHIFARERGDDSYRISTSWLNRLERNQPELTVNRLIALAHIYGVDPVELFRSIYPDTVGSDLPPDETALLSPESGPSPAPYKWGIIGKHDRTLEPLIPAGSVVQIDIRRREISPRKECGRELQRPIHFFKAGDTYFCGWCEFDPLGELLTLVPHPLSPASSRRWNYRKEVETIGRVVPLLPDPRRFDVE
jgi:transcriptional regulator with XRE-family HTH domain